MASRTSRPCWRLFRALGGDTAAALVRVGAGDAGRRAHRGDGGGAAVRRHAVSKTVDVPVGYPYEDFKNLYREAWRAGLKGLATYRPNTIVGAVLQTNEKGPPRPELAALRRVDGISAILRVVTTRTFTL